MGPKMERKKNTSGMSKPIIEFSDTELISDDEGGNQEYDPPTVPERIVGTNSPNISGSRLRKDEEKRSGTVVVNNAVKPTKDVNKQTQRDATMEILRPKRIREPEVRKSLTLENVCTSIFLSQLIIILVCVCIVTYGLNSYLNKTVHVSEIIDNSVDTDNEIKEAIDRKVSNVLDSRVKMVVQEEVSSSFSGVTHIIDNKISEHQQDIKSEFRSISVLKEEYTSFKENRNTKDEEISDTFTTMKKTLDHIKQEHNENKDVISDILDQSKGVKTDMNKLTDNYSSLLAIVNTDSDKIVGLQDTLHSEKQRVDDAIRELTKEQENLKETLSQANELREEYEAKVEMVNDINKKLEVIQPNVFNKEKFTIAFMILTLLVIGLLVAVFFLYQRPRAAADWASPAVMINSMNSNDIQKQVPQSPELKSSVCIISFDESRTAKHRGLLESAKVPNCKVLVHVIRKHEQIATLPRCKVYLMCTEFSERHVIIEEPGLGLRDLHRTTYYAVQKLGGCLIILYTRDPGSRNLKEDSLFNEKIHCVTHQQELSVLNNDGRFFSTYDNLTQNQKTQLRNKIVQNLTGQLS